MHEHDRPPMPLSPEENRALVRQGRIAALVIALTGVLWLLGQGVLSALDTPARWAALVDLLALAAFAWALVVVYRIWRKRRDT